MFVVSSKSYICPIRLTLRTTSCSLNEQKRLQTHSRQYQDRFAQPTTHYVRVFWIYTFCTNLNGSNLRHLVAEFCQTCDDFSSSPLQMLHSYAECVVFRNNRDENLSERFLGNNKLPASKTAARGAAARALASSSAWAAVSSGHGPCRLDAEGERSVFLSGYLPT